MKIQSRIILIFVTLLFVGCYKEPEDKFISLHLPWKRIVGTWKFTSYKIDGVESSHLLDSLFSPSALTSCSINFEGINGGRIGAYVIKNEDGGTVYHTGGDIYTFPAHQHLNIGSADSVFNAKFWKTNIKGPWLIMNLYLSDFHIRKGNLDIKLKRVK